MSPSRVISSSPTMSISRFKLVFFCPRASTRSVLDRLFTKYPEALGKIGEYEQCAFVTPGIGRISRFVGLAFQPSHLSLFRAGQFKPGPSAQPTIGSVGQLEYVEEDKVELVVNDQGANEEIKNAIVELKSVRISPRLCRVLSFLHTHLMSTGTSVRGSGLRCL